MEVKDENTFFKGQRFSKNLILAEDKDLSHLITRVKEEEKGEFYFFNEEKEFSDLMAELYQRSLFGERKIFLVIDSENYSEENWNQIFEQKEGTFYFFKKDAKKGLIDRFIKVGAVLSLIEEKLWDRKNRLVAEVIYTIHKDGVMISQPTAYRFVERTFSDLQLFHNELLKLRCYAYQKRKIEDADIDALVSALAEENSFKISEEMVWDGKGPNNFKIDSIASVLQMIGALRFQAYLGLKMLSKENVNMPPWQEKKYKQKAMAYGISFFKNIITSLFRIEERVKQTSISPNALFDIATLEILALARK
jgi:DNA polymerase III delta subunit